MRGRVWNDRNRNHQVDPAEPGIPGVQVELWRKGLLIRLANTWPDGQFAFSMLDPGTYQLIQRDLPGYRSTTPNTVDIVILPGQVVQVYFGDVVANAYQWTYIPYTVR